MEKSTGDSRIERVPTQDVSKERNPSIVADEQGMAKEAHGVKLDYSGAAKKVDPVEIKLVRKLDLWIMPMYDQIYLSKRLQLTDST
jgi:hypothetical protein